MKKHWKKVIVGLAILLTLTNPSVKDFQESINPNGKRTMYLLFFSVFEYDYEITKTNEAGQYLLGQKERHYGRYIGIFKNFIPIN